MHKKRKASLKADQTNQDKVPIRGSDVNYSSTETTFVLTCNRSSSKRSAHCVVHSAKRFKGENVGQGVHIGSFGNTKIKLSSSAGQSSEISNIKIDFHKVWHAEILFLL